MRSVGGFCLVLVLVVPACRGLAGIEDRYLVADGGNAGAQKDADLSSDDMQAADALDDSSAHDATLVTDAADASARQDDAVSPGDAQAPDALDDSSGAHASNYAPPGTPDAGARADVFWTKSSGLLTHQWFVGDWNGPRDLSVNLGLATPHPVATGDGSIDIFWTPGDGTAVYVRYDPSSAGWMSVPVTLPTGIDAGVPGCALASDPCPVSARAGLVDVFWKGQDGTLCHQVGSGTGGWSAPESLGGSLGSGTPHPVATGNGGLDVFWTGSDNNLWYLGYDPGDGGWGGQGPTSLGAGPLGSDPQPVSPAGGEVDVFWLGSDNGLWHEWYQAGTGSGGWNGPASLVSGSLGSPPHPVVTDDNIIDVFWRGLDSNLWHEWYASGTWNGPERLETGWLGSEPYPTSPGGGLVDVFWRGSDSPNSLWHAWYKTEPGWQGPILQTQDTGTLLSDPQPVSL